MPVRLVRTKHPVDTRDADATRAWMKDQIDEEIRRKGEPRPRLVRLDAEHVDTLDLTELMTAEPTAHVGATWEAMRSVRHDRRFFVMQLEREMQDGTRDRAALVVEELVDGPRRRWWMAILPYTTDATTGLGATGEWHDSRGETDDPRLLPPPFVALLMNSAGASAGSFLPPADKVVPDIQTAFGELPASAATPKTPMDMANLALALALEELLSGKVVGSHVVKLLDRRWEQWVIAGDLPAPLDEFIKYIANREEAADGVALVHAIIRPKDRPPVPGLQVLVELGGSRLSGWGPMEFPNGPSGRKEVPRIVWTGPAPIPADGMWIGVAADIGIEEPPLPEA